MTMRSPVHPGYIIRFEYLEPLNLSISRTAELLGVSRQALNNIVNGRAGISAEMAIRLEKAFATPAEFWLRLQSASDLASARKNQKEIKVRRIPGLGKHAA